MVRLSLNEHGLKWPCSWNLPIMKTVGKKLQTHLEELRGNLASAEVVKRRACFEAAKTAYEVIAMRGDFDGYGYKYIDAGSGSDWRTRYLDWEEVYVKVEK